MTHARTRSEREKWDEFWTARASDPAFITRGVAPLLPEVSGRHGDTSCAVEIVRAKATGRLTVRFDFAGVATVYAKIYYEKLAGENSRDWLRYLWQGGFDARSSCQVPEPLGYLAEEQILFMRAARGTPLVDVVATGPIEDAVRGVRAAAHWLAKFHSSTIPFLLTESACERIGLFKQASLLAKVAGGHPELAKQLIGLLRELHSVAPKKNLPPRLVPAHGQFRPEHVFVEGDRVSIIDLEGFHLSDPAKDVARFAHGIMKFCCENSVDHSRAVHLVKEYLLECELLEGKALIHVPYFRALYSLKELVKAMKSRKLEGQEREGTIQFYRDEFHRSLQQSFAMSEA